jgi:NADH:ubiquinone oxidoreductase subunit C
MQNPKLLFKYALFGLNFFFLRYGTQNRKSVSLLLPHYSLYFLITHVRLSSAFYIPQLVDIFSYELPINSTELKQNSLETREVASKAIIYHFHNLLTHNRIFIFSLNLKSLPKFSNVKSIAELFPNAAWLEREVAELFNFIFEGRKDTRNLMLQYGDSSAPFQKFFPSIGLKELSYDFLRDLVSQQNVAAQF